VRALQDEMHIAHRSIAAMIQRQVLWMQCARQSTGSAAVNFRADGVFEFEFK
jgi:hypothetical protein